MLCSKSRCSALDGQQLWERPVDMNVLFPIFFSLNQGERSVYMCIIMCSFVIKGLGGGISQPWVCVTVTHFSCTCKSCVCTYVCMRVSSVYIFVGSCLATEVF